MALWLVLPTSTTPIGGPDANGLSRDPSLLLPAFRARLEVLFARLRAQGFDPFLHEGYRTAARAAQLAKEGSGKAQSTHTYGIGADVISKSRGWKWPEFFVALGREAEALGMTWGGRWDTRVDQAHVQAVPVNKESMLVALAPTSRNAYAQKSMGA